MLGLRLVKKTVNQDDPTVYHLFYADEQGSPGADLTFFEYPGAGARRGRAPGWSTGSSGASARPPRSTSGSERLAAAASRRATATGSASPTPRGSSTSCASTTARTRR